ncbi:MAG: peptidase M61, partial [Limisphaerales bacterium]
MRKLALPIVCALAPLFGYGQNSAPEAELIRDDIPPVRDVVRPGVITIAVDASDVTRGIFQVSETIPVPGSGPLVLLYPKWLPGQHAPSGPIAQLAGLKLSAGGVSLPWRRDSVDVFAFHVAVPEGASNVEAHFQFLAPTDIRQGRIVTTPDMLNLQWSSVAL